MVQRRNPSEKSNTEELLSLAKAADYEVVGTLEQTKLPSPRYNIGSGKARELADLVISLRAEKIIFGGDLKVVQVYNLAKLTRVEVVDRFQLILEIFLRRASTREAKLQIDLASLRYELAHAKEKVRWARIDEQPGFQGLGKYEVDVYYETVRRQIYAIQEKLKGIMKTRRLHRQSRERLGLPVVSLAGYTNSGKSTLFNSLASENVPANDGLFTTLSTTVRMIDFSGDRAFLTDTVGFIDRLPLMLIEAFRSTLEEALFSDLILLVVDMGDSNSEIERKLWSCLDTIRDIGAASVPVLVVMNKIDLLSEEELGQKLGALDGFPFGLVPVSALRKTNLDLLEAKMAELLHKHVETIFTVPVNGDSMSFLSWVFEHTDVHDVVYQDEVLNVRIGARPHFADVIRDRVERLGGVFGYG